MIVSIHQPSYWPWLGLLDKIAKTDNFILLDNAQVVKGTYQYRNIFFCNGDSKFITIPLNLNLGMNFNEITFRNNNWQSDHLNKLHNYYLKAPYFSEVYEELDQFYSKKFDKPIDLLKETMIFSFDKFGIKVRVLISSTFNVSGSKGDMVLNLCKAAGADEYLAGRGSFQYMQEYLLKFDKENIKVKWHSFKHPIYDQHPKFPFVEGLSCLDIFFFKGIEKARKIFWDNVAQDYGKDHNVI